MRVFVDTNVFVRLTVVSDDDRQMKQAKKMFEHAKTGKLDLVTGPSVLFEIAWVLGRLYKRANGELLNFLEAIPSFPNLKVLDKEVVLEAISLGRKTDETFADCYIAVSAHRVEAEYVATFNKKRFAKLETELYPFEGDK